MTQKNIVVLGAGPAGVKFNEVIAKKFKDAYITVIEKQEEVQYNIAMPRALVDKEFASKSFIKLDNMVKNGKVIHGTVTGVSSNQVTLQNGETVPFDYLVIATGSRYDGIFKNQTTTKAEGLALIHDYIGKINAAQKIVLVGGGSAGIEVAGEIKETYPQKEVIIVHSQSKLLTDVYADDVRDRFLEKLKAKNVKVVFNEKVNNLESWREGPHVLETASGKKIESDLTINCAGRLIPNTSFLTELNILNENKEVKVRKTLQVDRYDHIFAMGDVAATGASKTVINLDSMAATIADNILAIEKKAALKEFSPMTKPLILATVGRKDGTGYLPFMPFFAIEFMVRKLKGPDMFFARNAGFYGHKVE
jgi:NADH dehydrogenase FAD-containing subunit